MATAKKRGRGRRVLGFVLAGLGVISIADFFSPFRTGLIAIVSGTLLLGAGFYVIYLRDMDWLTILRRAISPKERGRIEERPSIDPLVPVQILKLAQEKGGLLTVSMISMALNVPLDIAEAGIQECVRKGVAVGEYNEAKSTVMYRFPEFLP